MTARRGMTFDTFVDACSPRLWHVRVRSLKLDDPDAAPVRTTFPMPEDRDLANEIARRGYPAGKYGVTPQWPKARGESFEMERRRLRLDARTRIPQGVVIVTAAHVAAPASQRKSNALASARERRQLEEESAAEAAAKADRATALARARKAERDAGDGEDGRWTTLLEKLLEDRGAPKDGGLLAVLPLLMEQQRKASDSHTQLLQALLQQAQQEKQGVLVLLQQQLAAPAREGGGSSLPKVIEQLTALERLRDLVADRFGGAKEEGDGWLATLREIKGMLAYLPQARTAQGAAAASVPSTSSSVEQPAAAGPPPDATTMVQDRLRRFLEALAAEAAIGSDPEAVADILLDEHVDLLPLPVRTPLLRGDWPGAKAAIAGYVGAFELPAAIEQFAAAVVLCMPVDEDKTERLG